MKKFTKAQFKRIYVDSKWAYAFEEDYKEVDFCKELIKNIDALIESVYEKFKLDVKNLSLKELIIKWFDIKEDKYNEAIKEAEEKFLNESSFAWERDLDRNEQY